MTLNFDLCVFTIIITITEKNVPYERLNVILRAGVCRDTSCNFSLCRRVEKVCVDRQLLRYS